MLAGLWLSLGLGAQTAAPARKVITPFISYSVMLQDTMKLSSVIKQTGDMSVAQYQLYDMGNIKSLNPSEFVAYLNLVWKMAGNPKSKLYNMVGQGAVQLSRKELRDIMVRCDTVEMSSYDKTGAEKITRVYSCDSVGVLYQADRIRFYEAWYFNENTYSIEKEVLGYTVEKNTNQGHYALFNVFRDEKAMAVATRYLGR